MKKTKLLLAALALVLVVSVSIGSASAFFTAYEIVEGEGSITFTPSTEITEEDPDPKNGIKAVTVSNTSKDMTVFFRAKVFTTADIDGISGWSTGSGGYYYYGSESSPTPVGPGESAPMTIGFELPDEAADGDEINIIVVYEATPAIPKGSGFEAPDWAIKVPAAPGTGG